MPQTKTKPAAAREEWRKFWNSIGGSEIDATSLKKTAPRRLTQKQLNTYLQHCHRLIRASESYKKLNKALSKRFLTMDAAKDKWMELIDIYESECDEILEALRSGASIEPGELSAVRDGKTFQLLRNGVSI